MKTSQVAGLALLVCLPALAGCGKNLAGTYTASVRLAGGKQQSTPPGYLADMKQQLQTTYRRELVLNADNTYAETFGKRTNRGNWTSSGDVLTLNDTDSNGVAIQPRLKRKNATASSTAAARSSTTAASPPTELSSSLQRSNCHRSRRGCYALEGDGIFPHG